MRATMRADNVTCELVGLVDTHFQLIYEALEIAANSKDPFAAQFASLRDSLLEQSENWR